MKKAVFLYQTDKSELTVFKKPESVYRQYILYDGQSITVYLAGFPILKMEATIENLNKGLDLLEKFYDDNLKYQDHLPINLRSSSLPLEFSFNESGLKLKVKDFKPKNFKYAAMLKNDLDYILNEPSIPKENHVTFKYGPKFNVVELFREESIGQDIQVGSTKKAAMIIAYSAVSDDITCAYSSEEKVQFEEINNILRIALEERNRQPIQISKKELEVRIAMLPEDLRRKCVKMKKVWNRQILAHQYSTSNPNEFRQTASELRKSIIDYFRSIFGKIGHNETSFYKYSLNQINLTLERIPDVDGYIARLSTVNEMKGRDWVYNIVYLTKFVETLPEFIKQAI